MERVLWLKGLHTVDIRVYLTVGGQGRKKIEEKKIIAIREFNYSREQFRELLSNFFRKGGRG